MKKFLLTCVLMMPLHGAPAEAHFYSGCLKNKCKRHVVKPFNTKLNNMHWCEARGVGWFRDGAYDGGLQFHPNTWRATRSRYNFAYNAPILEQKYRAVVWASMIGWRWRSTAGWPRCG